MRLLREATAIGAIVAFFLGFDRAGNGLGGHQACVRRELELTVRAKVQRDSCGSYIGTVNIHTIGSTGHWDIVVNGSKVRSEPTSGEAWLGTGVTRT